MTPQPAIVPDCPPETRRLVKEPHPCNGGASVTETVPWCPDLICDISRHNGNLSPREVHHCLMSGHTVSTGFHCYSLAEATR